MMMLSCTFEFQNKMKQEAQKRNTTMSAFIRQCVTSQITQDKQQSTCFHIDEQFIRFTTPYCPNCGHKL